jgi:hypothetical protein
MKYILRLEDGKGNGANLTKPCNWKSVNEAKEQASCLDIPEKGQVLMIRFVPKLMKRENIFK